MNFIKHLYYRLFVARGSGFKKTRPDARDFDTLDIGWFGYTPKHSKHEIKTLSVKNQSPNNTCTWEAGTVQKEVDESVVLSVGSVVSEGKRKGLLRGNGWAGLDGVQKVLKAWGIMTERDAPTVRNWVTLSTTATDKLKASKHQTKSYWLVNSSNAKLKALDENRVITTAINWYTGYNARYLRSDSLIMTRKGYKVGGHSFCIVGYDMNYYGTKVYICQNSYGTTWGDGGKFYVYMDFLDKEMYWGSYVNLDMGVDVGSFIKSFAQKNVKANNSPAIYHISMGKKRLYPNWFTFLCWNNNTKGFVSLNEEESETLKALPKGEPMNAEKAPLFRDHSSKLKGLTAPENLDKILEIINKNK